jgi:hypothetical protein
MWQPLPGLKSTKLEGNKTESQPRLLNLITLYSMGEVLSRQNFPAGPYFMDPISALGVAGSVVGIASFGLQLSQALYQFISQTRSAKESLRSVLDGINATTTAMN